MRFRDDSGRVDRGQIGEMEMTNHIEEAIAELGVAEHYTKYEMVAESHMESAKAHALIAIAQQLRIINLIGMGLAYTPDGTPNIDVAEALGIKEEK
jgi:hypothetical protein